MINLIDTIKTSRRLRDMADALELLREHDNNITACAYAGSESRAHYAIVDSRTSKRVLMRVCWGGDES